MTDVRVYHVMAGVLKRKGRPDVTPPTAGGLGIAPLGTVPLGGSS